MDFIIYVGTFIVIYLMYLLFVILRKKKLEKFKTSTYVSYLINMYKLDLKKMNITILAHEIALINAFILATSLYVFGLFENITVGIVVAILTVFALIFIMYHILGKMYQKKEVK